MSDNKKKREQDLAVSGAFSITVKVKILNVVGGFADLLNAIADCKASVAEVSLLYSDFHSTIRTVTVNTSSEMHSKRVLKGVEEVENLELLSWWDDTLEIHLNGKMEIALKAPLLNNDQLARAYTPGVARVCTMIQKDPELAYTYTTKKNMVAVVTDGSAVLGLGNIGPKAALPVMEGKAVLFKQFGEVDAVPICLDTTDTEEVISIIKNISPAYGGINLEDIAAPSCFEIESRLMEELDIPVFHDDQHGTAAVVLAGIYNALKITGKSIGDVRVVVNGFGAGGVACTKMLLNAGVQCIIPCDSAGIVYEGRKERMNPIKEELLASTNPENMKGDLKDALKGADIFIGVSKPGLVTREMVKSMADDPIVFALANPVPEVLPEEIKDVARVIATGRSDYPNQVNNVLCFPGLFRGALDAKATRITEAMKIASAEAIADSVEDSELREDYIIPSVFRGNVAKLVAERVAAAVD